MRDGEDVGPEPQNEVALGITIHVAHGGHSGEGGGEGADLRAPGLLLLPLAFGLSARGKVLLYPVAFPLLGLDDGSALFAPAP